MNYFLDNELLPAESKYYKTWNNANGRTCYHLGTATNTDLGNAKKVWREKKNYACHIILNLYKSLSSINGEMNQLGIKYHFEQGIEKITKSKEYYSFLNKDEIKKMEEENKARKLNAKRLDLRPN